MENTIQTIQGMIDIEKTKSDRILNQTVGIVGVGLATSQIASAVILTQDKPNPEVALNYRIEVFLSSLGIGLLAAMVAFVILRLARRGWCFRLVYVKSPFNAKIIGQPPLQNTHGDVALCHGLC